jgi:hypothetical protein
MECQIPEKPQLSRIYRVDTGVSRDNDEPMLLHIKTVQQENQFLYSRTPQILKIDKNGNFFIIKSKIRHARCHSPRPKYEEYASQIPALRLDNSYYQQKYLKYKNKYLQLKQIINTP